MTKQEIDFITKYVTEYIDKRGLVKCPYDGSVFVPEACLRLCDTCTHKKAGYEHSMVWEG